MSLVFRKLKGKRFPESLDRALPVVEWAFFALIALFAFAVFYYTDFSDTLDNAMLLGDSILDGKFGSYYEFAARNAGNRTVYTANYDVFLYLVFLIWDLPVFILHRLNLINHMSSTVALLWCKSLIAASLTACAFFLRKIISRWVKSRRVLNGAVIMFLASGMTVFPALVVCQYDALSTALMLAGLYFYIERKEKLFFLMFALAVPLKMFALFLFIPLLLLREKRIWAIVLKMIPAFAVNFVFSLPFRGDAWYELCLGSQNKDAVDLILDSSVKIGNASVCPFIAAFFVLCVICYTMKSEKWDADHSLSRFQVPVYVCAAAMAMFVCLVNIRSYWCVIAVPFLVAVAFSDPEKLRINSLLTIAASACGTLYFLMHHWVFSSRHIVDFLALSRFVSPAEGYEYKYGNIGAFFREKELMTYEPFVYSVFVASVILLLAFNVPKEKTLSRRKNAKFAAERWHSLLQIALTGALVALIFVTSSATQRVPLIETTGADYSEDIFAGSTVSADFVAPESRDVTELSFTAGVGSPDRSVRSTLTVTLENARTGETLVSRTVGTVLLTDKAPYKLDISGVRLEKGEEYRVTFSAQALRSSGQACTVLCGEDGAAAILIR